jgi:hypothetical protein
MDCAEFFILIRACTSTSPPSVEDNFASGALTVAVALPVNFAAALLTSAETIASRRIFVLLTQLKSVIAFMRTLPGISVDGNIPVLNDK